MKSEIKIIKHEQEGFSRKLSKSEANRYMSICMDIWGGCPRDVDWAMGTGIYKDASRDQKWNELENANLDSKLKEWR